MLLSTATTATSVVIIIIRMPVLRHIGLLEADKDKIRKIRPKGTQVRMLYDLADKTSGAQRPESVRQVNLPRDI